MSRGRRWHSGCECFKGEGHSTKAWHNLGPEESLEIKGTQTLPFNSKVYRVCEDHQTPSAGPRESVSPDFS